MKEKDAYQSARGYKRECHTGYRGQDPKTSDEPEGMLHGPQRTGLKTSEDLKESQQFW